jgi:lipopolysaccharide transport system ATP-binding protein
MSSDLAIRVKGLGKTYRVFSRPQDRLKQMFLGHWRKYYHEFWALQDVDLEVRRGEVVGIVGRNGSGKSTLLQMICGIFAPVSTPTSRAGTTCFSTAASSGWTGARWKRGSTRSPPLPTSVSSSTSR